MNSRMLLCFIFVFMIMAGMALAQEIPVPMKPSNLSFSPREHLQKLADAKAQQLDRQRTYEKLLETETTTNWPEYDISYYDIDWRIDEVNEVIYGSVGIYGFPTVAELDSVVIDLDHALTVDSVYDADGLLNFAHTGNFVTVKLRALHTPSDQFGFTVVYHGQPGPLPDGTEGLVFYSNSGSPMIYNESEPYRSRLWWPCNDIPQDKADSIDIKVTVADGLVVSSNGLIASETDNGDGTHTTHWRSHFPISTYLVCLGICNYIRWDDYYHYSPTDSMPIYNFVFPDQLASSHDLLSVTSYSLNLFAGLFGEYPFISEKYGHTYSGIYGMEYQTNTFINDGTPQETIVHEAAHQWWGDMVTCSDWPNIWLNEGFATYCEGLYYESVGGAALYHDYMDGATYLEGAPGHSIYVEDTTDSWGIFSWRVYSKGAWVLHMLRHIVGDETFFDILHQYRAEYEFSTATTPEFQAVCEAVSGLDLSVFFQQWIYQYCQPDYRHSFYTEPNSSGGWDIYVHLRQIQTSIPQVFVMPLDLNLITYAGEIIGVIIQNDSREQDYFFHTDNQPKGLDLDPDNWVLCLKNWEQYGLRILTDSLVDGVQGQPYYDSIIVKGGYPGHDHDIKVIAGDWPAGLDLNPITGVITGTTYATGDVSFTIEATDELYPASYADTMTYAIYFDPTPPRPGDVNTDGEVNVGDVVYLINYVFKSGPAPAVANWADANADCAVNVGDAVYLIAFTFNSGPPPQLGCVD